MSDAADRAQRRVSIAAERLRNAEHDVWVAAYEVGRECDETETLTHGLTEIRARLQETVEQLKSLIHDIRQSLPDGGK